MFNHCLVFTLIFSAFISFSSCQKVSETTPKVQQDSKEDSKPSPEFDEFGLSHSMGIIKTVHGNIIFKFYFKQAPNTSQRIIKLIKEGFYDGLDFHRAIKGFIIQTGSPDNSVDGGSGMRLKAELSNLKHIKGSLSMARRVNDIDSADSQFFITLRASEELDGKYTIFGQVVKGLEVLDKIQKGDKIITLEYIQ